MDRLAGFAPCALHARRSHFRRRGRPPPRSRTTLAPRPEGRMIDLRGRPIAITGASSGIACADAGMPVAVGARRADRLEQLVAEITARGGRAVAVTMDVARPDDGRRLVERAVEAFGSLYAVFANAGVGLHKPIHHTTDDEM